MPLTLVKTPEIINTELQRHYFFATASTTKTIKAATTDKSVRIHRIIVAGGGYYELDFRVGGDSLLHFAVGGSVPADLRVSDLSLISDISSNDFECAIVAVSSSRVNVNIFYEVLDNA